MSIKMANVYAKSMNTSTSPALSVSELTFAIKQCLEPAFTFVHLHGEVSNCKLHGSGHLYFSLKDANAQISAVMYRMDAQTLTKLPKDGDQVTVKGNLSLYPQSGKYQINVRDLTFTGLGELLLKLEQLKIKLNKMGWFKADRKKPIPKFPKTIGIVTSPTGAAIQDILKVLTRRFTGVKVILNPVKVQGEGSAQDIAKAIEQFNKFQLVDVMIVGRGGGSIEDLWSFNEEIVAQAIHDSKIPIICAVGHETDHTIAEYVADLRAPTPSAAAEMVIAETSSQLNHLQHLERRILQGVNHHLKHCRQQLIGMMRHPVFINPYAMLGPWMQRLDELKVHLDRQMLNKLHQKQLKLEGFKKQAEALKPTAQIAHHRHKLLQYDLTLNRLSSNLLNLKRIKLDKLSSTLKALDPRNVLAKGYSILFSEKDHSVITSVHALRKNANIRILMHDGETQATITGEHKSEKN